MAAMAEQPFPVFQHHHQHQLRHDSDNFARYPEPPQNAFTSPPMGINIAAEAAFGPTFPRSGHEVYPPTTAPMGFEASLYAETPNYILNSRASPGSYHDESDMRLPSSSLSTASVPSAPSSVIGSPQSNHGQLGGVPEWSAQGMAVQPSIVGNDYMTGAEYFAGAAAMEDFGGFDFGAAQPKTFVGEFFFSSILLGPVTSASLFPPGSRWYHDTFRAPHYCRLSRSFRDRWMRAAVATAKECPSRCRAGAAG